MATATTNPRHWPTSEHAELFAAISSLRTKDEVERFLRDLCTISELDAMAHRWQVAQLLDEGLPYREVARRGRTATTPGVPGAAGGRRRGEGGSSLGLRRRRRKHA